VANRRSLPDLEERMRRLVITEHLGVYETLLRQPYDIYRPVMDLLLEGTIFPEDLSDDPLILARGARALAAAKAAQELSESYLTEAMAKSVLVGVANGKDAAFIPMAFDHNQQQIDDETGAVNGQFIPAHLTAASTDFDSISPSAIERLRGGGLDGGKKLAQEAFLLAKQAARAGTGIIYDPAWANAGALRRRVTEDGTVRVTEYGEMRVTEVAA